jgi:catechol 2,3-dioxygenase-like lactoylglutathione lyase family enzyme
MSRTSKPVLHPPRPAIRVGDFDQAIAHYVDWLGFTLDSEWREAPGQPAIGFLSRDHFVFMINEHPNVPGPASIHLDVSNLEVLAREWNERRPGSVTIHRAPPYEFPEVAIEDPWGNRLFFEGKIEAEEQERRALVHARMKSFVENEIEAGRPLPTPEALRDAVGPPLGTAIEVLNEYPAYGELFDARRAAATKPTSEQSEG